MRKQHVVRVLLTSFEPFAGQAVNASLEVGRGAAARPPAGISVDWLVLPVTAKACVDRAWERIEAVRPDLVLCLGQSDGAAELRVERRAVNVNDFPIPDNAGAMPRHERISREGPAAYDTTIPVQRVVRALRENGIAARLSHSAGTFVCNHLLYGLLHRSAGSRLRHRTGFVHVPLLPGQGHRSSPPPTAPTCEHMVAGIGVLLTTCLKSLRA